LKILFTICGVALILLAAAKVFGIITLLVNGSEQETFWFVKQGVFAVAFASLGWRLMARAKM